MPFVFLAIVTLLSGCLTDTQAVTPCTTSATCPAAQPFCDPAIGGCAACSDSAQCASRTETPLCNLGTGACVECLTDGNCDGETPMCDPETATCVQCVDSNDCSGETPVCDGTSQTCVECTVSADCSGETPVCDGTSQTCVECLTDTDCAPTACRPDNTCGSVAVGTLGSCERCEADSECGDELSQPSSDDRCVPMMFDGARFPNDTTGFCLKTNAGGCEQPFSIDVTETSLSGTSSATYCGINESLTTCDAVRALLDNTPQCPGGDDSECPTGALCRQVGSLMNRCTYECSDPVECKNPPVPGNTCALGGTAGPTYCGG